MVTSNVNRNSSNMVEDLPDVGDKTHDFLLAETGLLHISLTELFIKDALRGKQIPSGTILYCFS